MKDNIRRLRQKAGLTQAELAERLGYSSQSAIGMWELGVRKPPSDILPALAKALNCEIADLYAQN